MAVSMPIAPDEILPTELRIDSIDDKLYQIGLTIKSIDQSSKRNLLHNPVFIFICTMLNLTIFEVSVLFIDDELIQTILGIPGHFFGVKVHFLLFFSLVSLFIMGSQLTHHYNHRQRIEPTFLAVFHVMSGSATPLSVGLYKDQDILTLLNRCRNLNNMYRLNNNVIIPIVAWTFIALSYYMCVSFENFLLFGIPNAFLIALKSHHFWNILGYQFIYFYINSLYINFKMRNINNFIKNVKSPRQLKPIFQQLDALYREINDCNTKFCSKFLFSIWQLFGSLIVLTLWMTVFSQLEIFMKLTGTYLFIIFSTMFLFILFTASTVNYEAIKTYKIFCSMYVRFNTRVNRKRYNLPSKLKVCTNSI